MYRGGVELNWYLGFIPATDYSVYIWDKDTEVHISTASDTTPLLYTNTSFGIFLI